jgi:RIO kinase 1
VPAFTATGRPAPDWLISDAFEDSTVGVLKSGKEAEVFLVERVSPDRTCLLAHKRYRPRRPKYKGELRDLGFSKGTIYHHDVVYRAGWHLSSRDRRAVETHTRYGQGVTAALWPENEIHMLRRAWNSGASVPYPVDRTDDGVLMEYLGDRLGAAPRIVDARLSPDGLRDAWRQLVESLRLLTRAGVVHADMSVYNLLWWQERLVIIDFPQAVDVITNLDAMHLLDRDVANVATWFGRRGVPIDAGAVFAELLAEAW